MKNKRILTNDKIYKVQRLQTFLGILLYWKTDGYWNTMYSGALWTHYEFESLKDAQRWLVNYKVPNTSKRKWKVVK